MIVNDAGILAMGVGSRNNAHLRDEVFLDSAKRIQVDVEGGTRSVEALQHAQE